MPEESPETHSEIADHDTLSHEPITRASGSPVSARLVALVTGILVAVVIAAAIFAYSQGVFAHPVSSY